MVTESSPLRLRRPFPRSGGSRGLRYGIPPPRPSGKGGHGWQPDDAPRSSSGPPVEVSMSLREKILQFVSSPDIAYLLLTAGVLAIIFEVMSPGGFVLGTAGAVMVLLGAFGLRMLPSTGRASSFSPQAWASWSSTCWWANRRAQPVRPRGPRDRRAHTLPCSGVSFERVHELHRRNVYRPGAVLFAALYLVLRSLKRRTPPQEGMIGMEAEVMEDLAPVGLVKCRGDLEGKER